MICAWIQNVNCVDASSRISPLALNPFRKEFGRASRASRGIPLTSDNFDVICQSIGGAKTMKRLAVQNAKMKSMFFRSARGAAVHRCGGRADARQSRCIRAHPSSIEFAASQETEFARQPSERSLEGCICDAQNIWFAYDPNNRSVIVGPARANQVQLVHGSSMTVPQLMEEGGVATIDEESYDGSRWFRRDRGIERIRTSSIDRVAADTRDVHLCRRRFKRSCAAASLPTCGVILSGGPHDQLRCNQSRQSLRGARLVRPCRKRWLAWDPNSRVSAQASRWLAVRRSERLPAWCNVARAAAARGRHGTNAS